MYVKVRESGLRFEAYFNRKGCDNNNERGHFVKVDEEIMC